MFVMLFSDRSGFQKD